MDVNTLFLLLIAVVLYFIPTVAIQKFLMKYSDKTPNLITMHMHMFQNLKKYRKTSKIKYGKVGVYYRMWFVSLGISLSLIVLGIINISFH